MSIQTTPESNRVTKQVGPDQPEISQHNPIDGEVTDAIVRHEYNIFEPDAIGDEPRANTTDYDFPEWFWDDDVTDKERSRWMTQDRCRRQVKRQFEAGAMKATEAMFKGLTRERRKVEASNDWVKTEEYR